MNYPSSSTPNECQLLSKHDDYLSYINADYNSYDNETYSFFNDDFPVLFPAHPKASHSDRSTEKQTTANDNYSFPFQNQDILSTISDTFDEERNLFTQPPQSNYFLIIKDFSNKKHFHFSDDTKRGNTRLFTMLNDKRLKRLYSSVHISSPAESKSSAVLKDKNCKAWLKCAKKKLKVKRKFKPDDIRKKIKARFHKTLKSILNSFLLKAGSQKVFDFLPQCFVSNISKKMNYNALVLTLREIFEFDFCGISLESRSKNITVDKRKHKNNLDVLHYLDNNPDIAEKSGFTRFAQKSYCQILKEYFVSEEFLHSLKKLKYEKESEEYIAEYKKKALDYVAFFSRVDTNNSNINNN